MLGLDMTSRKIGSGMSDHPSCPVGVKANRVTSKTNKTCWHYWGSKDKLLSDCQWTTTHRHTSIGQPAKTYIHHLCADTGCSLEDLPEVMENRDRGQERDKGLHAIKHDLMKMMYMIHSHNSKNNR